MMMIDVEEARRMDGGRSSPDAVRHRVEHDEEVAGDFLAFLA